jgi:hypothetical protein
MGPRDFSQRLASLSLDQNAWHRQQEQVSGRKEEGTNVLLHRDNVFSTRRAGAFTILYNYRRYAYLGYLLPNSLCYANNS